MWVEWSVGGAADLAKRNPEPPTGGEAYTDLLYEVPRFLTLTVHISLVPYPYTTLLSLSNNRNRTITVYNIFN
jgi:hypothetical protein